MQPGRTRSIVFIALGIALMAASAQVTIPIGPVPFTLQTLVLVLICLLYKPSQAFLVALGYVLLGLVGLPIFAGFKGGLSVIVGPTGGFIAAFVVCVAVAANVRALMLKSQVNAIACDVVAVALIILITYLLGWAQLMLVSGMTPAEAFASGVAPFIVIDVLKGAVGIAAAAAVRRALGERASALT